MAAQPRKNRRRKEPDLGGLRTWRGSLEEKWSGRQCAVIKDLDCWLAGGPAQGRKKRYCARASPKEEEKPKEETKEPVAGAPPRAAPEQKKRRQSKNSASTSKTVADAGIVAVDADSEAVVEASTAYVSQLPHYLSPGLTARLGKHERLTKTQVVNTFLAEARRRGLYARGEVVFPRRLATLFGVPNAPVSKLLSVLEPQMSTMPWKAPGGESTCSGTAQAEAPAEASAAVATKRRQRWRPAALASLQEDADLLEMTASVTSAASGSNLRSFQRPLRSMPESTPHGRASTTPSVRAVASTAVVPRTDKENVVETSQEFGGRQRNPRKPSRDTGTSSTVVVCSNALGGSNVTSNCQPQSEPQSSSVPRNPASVSTHQEVLPALQRCVRQLVPRLSWIGPSDATVTIGCRANEALFRFEVVAEPSVESKFGDATQRAVERLSWRQPCDVRVRTGPTGELEGFGEVKLNGLDPEVAYNVFFTVWPRQLSGQAEGGAFTRSVAAVLPQRARPREWTPHEVSQWALSSVKVPEFAPIVEKYSIDGSTLLSLSKEDLLGVGIQAPFLIRRVMEAKASLVQK